MKMQTPPQVLDTNIPSENLRLEKYINKIKIPESIRGEKEVEEILPFTHDTFKIENENKKVLEHQFVTTS